MINSDHETYNSSKNLTMLISLYTLTSSRFNSSINTVTSLLVAADTAFTFTALSMDMNILFSALMFMYILSIIFYIFIICMYLNCKKYIEKAICNDGKNIIDIISDLKKNDTYILVIATMMAVSSIGMFVLLSEIIF